MILNQANLGQITGVRTPHYDRGELTAGIVHIGMGNFHRAHQAWYLHRLMDAGRAKDWAIIGAGVRGYDADMRGRMMAQDYLTTLIELGESAPTAEIIGSIIGYTPIEPDNAGLIKQMAHASIRIVSLTITESGYFIDPATLKFDANHPDIIHDAQNPTRPRTVFGAMVAALAMRKDAGISPFECLSCDNIQGNGAVLRQTVVGLARLSDPDLADWIDKTCGFPNSMVDCIVPATGQVERALPAQFGITDTIPVSHEDFRQWVIEDKFCAGRPPLEQVGVTFTTRVCDYEQMKIRVLNGGHQIIAAVADLLAIKTIADAMAHPAINAMFMKIVGEEILPHVVAVPDYSPADYVALVARRFANTAVFDTPRRVAFDGSARHPGFLLPSVRDCLEAGINVAGLALTSAIWARYCLGVREDNSVIEANDPDWADLQIRATHAKDNPIVWLENTRIYGDLASRAEFAEPFTAWLTQIYAGGIDATLDVYLR